MLLWYMLALSAKCSGFDEIPLDRAEQSSDLSLGYVASKAIDNSVASYSLTKKAANNWLSIYFKNSSVVEKVVIVVGYERDSTCVNVVSVMDGEAGTVCGTYIGKGW